MRNIILVLPIVLSAACYADSDYIYLTINNESKFDVRVTTGRIFTHKYDVAPHSSESHWYVTGMIWNVKAYFKTKAGDYKRMNSCKLFSWYDKSFSFKIYDSPSKDEPVCQIYNY